MLTLPYLQHAPILPPESTYCDLINRAASKSDNAVRSSVWVTYQGHSLLHSDRSALLGGAPVSPIVVKFGIAVLSDQFPAYFSLHQPQLLSDGLSHWILLLHATKAISSDPSDPAAKTAVHSQRIVYDSLHLGPTLSPHLMRQLGVSCRTPFEPLVVHAPQQQTNVIDGGCFALVWLTNLAAGNLPEQSLDTTRLRSHFVSCLEAKTFSPFPTTSFISNHPGTPEELLRTHRRARQFKVMKRMYMQQQKFASSAVLLETIVDELAFARQSPAVQLQEELERQQLTECRLGDVLTDPMFCPARRTPGRS